MSVCRYWAVTARVMHLLADKSQQSAIDNHSYSRRSRFIFG